MGPPAAGRTPDGFLKIMMYGLLRPICDNAAPTIPRIPTRNGASRKYSGQEGQRNDSIPAPIHCIPNADAPPKGVSASFEGILFYIAFAISVVLAFADIGERTTAHSLVFGMLISWFPLLLLFAILDRNPTSAGRSRDLISRWMWNVRAVKEWRAEADLKSPQCGGRRTARMSRSRSLILLVRGARSGTMVSLSQSWTALRQQQHQQQHPRLPTPQIAERERLTLGHLDAIFRKTVARVQNCGPPAAWWVLAMLSFAIVWVEIGRRR